MHSILHRKHMPELLYNTQSEESCLSSPSLLFNYCCSIKRKGKWNTASGPIFLSAALWAVCTAVLLNDLLSKSWKCVAVTWQSNSVGHMRIWVSESLTEGNRWEAILRLSDENMGRSVRWLCGGQRRALQISSVGVCVQTVYTHMYVHRHTLYIKGVISPSVFTVSVWLCSWNLSEYCPLTV